MQLLELTLATAAENVALDEALLEEVDAGRINSEILRLWESPHPAVVIGRSSRAADEVNLQYCQRQQIPILRRCSGGAAVVLGPGCSMYSLVLRYSVRPELHLIDQAHGQVLSRIAESFRSFQLDVQHQGISDLALGFQKVSGNSLRCKREALLYHGTLLFQFPLDAVSACLRTAPRQPKYRAGRSHSEFVKNLPLSREEVRSAMLQAWQTEGALPTWPRELTAKLVEERYSRDEWNLKF